MELVEDLTSKTFRKSVKSLMTRRGTPQRMVSDNTKTFQATARWLQLIDKHARLTSRAEFNWRFNLSRSPCWGGFFERMIGMVKTTPKKTLGQVNLTVSELQEVLLDIEFFLNN